MLNFEMNNRVSDILKTGKQQVELPMSALTRMCYSYLHNDWLVFLSSALKLLVALIMILIGYFNSLHRMQFPENNDQKDTEQIDEIENVMVPTA